MTAEMESEESQKLSFSIKVVRKLTPLVQVEVEPIGKWFHYQETARARTHSGCLDGASFDSSDEDDVEDMDKTEVEVKDDITYLRSLDPADWKHQDHYAVLGLKNYRYKASEEDIKRAYRLMVLRHHPDKRKGAGEEIRDGDDYFTCITKAYEILGVPAKRTAYDSVDPEFDDSIPSATTAKKNGFFETLAPVIERNARWSTRKHVPLLGNPSDAKQKVDKFYNFWFDFDSWREFSYLDEEEKEKGQDRDERRWIEKQNKAERAVRRKEEMARLRKLVDLCYSLDPRVIKFREEEKEKKLALKKAKQEAIRLKQEMGEKAKREEEQKLREQKAAIEAEQKAKLEAERKEREAAKKILKKERKTLRSLCSDQKYFTEDEAERVRLMTDVELLCEALSSASLRQLNERLEQSSSCSSEDHSTTNSKQILIEEVCAVKNRSAEQAKQSNTARPAASSGEQDGSSFSGKKWSTDDIQTLIKAVNLFPAGTSKRWEVVAEYLNQHSTCSTPVKRTAKEVLNKAKELQSSDQQIREAAKKNAFQGRGSEKSGPTIDQSQASVRFETPQEMLGVNLTAWSAEEQRLLEQALKTYSASTPDRWDCIASCLPNRSKKECMKRYKELVEMVKAKKAAQAAAANSNR